VRDHFAAHMITAGHKNAMTIAQDRLIEDQAAAGNKFYQEMHNQRVREKTARSKLYVSQIKRVLKPGGRIVLANDTRIGRQFADILKSQGFKISGLHTLDRHTSKFGLAGTHIWLRPEEKLQVVIATKPR